MCIQNANMLSHKTLLQSLKHNYNGYFHICPGSSNLNLDICKVFKTILEFVFKVSLIKIELKTELGLFCGGLNKTRGSLTSFPVLFLNRRTSLQGMRNARGFSEMCIVSLLLEAPACRRERRRSPPPIPAVPEVVARG